MHTKNKSVTSRDCMLHDNQNKKRYSGSYQIRVDQNKINVTSVQLYFGTQEEAQNGGKKLYMSLQLCKDRL